MTDQTAPIPDFLLRHLAERETARNTATAEAYAALTEREQRLVREAAVMGYVQGTRHPADEKHPKDSWVTALVVQECLAFPDLYPTMNAVRDAARQATVTDQTLRRNIAEALLARAKQGMAVPLASQGGPTTSLFGADEYDLADAVLAVLAVRDAARQAAGQPVAAKKPVVDELSARDSLYLYAMVGKVKDDSNSQMAVRKLDAYREEILAEAKLSAALAEEDYQRVVRAASQLEKNLRARIAELEAVQQQPAVEQPAEELTASDRQFLTFALDLADNRMANRSDEFDTEDYAALARLRQLAEEGAL